ncbi:transcription elongation factor GreA [Halanaerobacter jeridensis]|uniref:Transcription elongation factor GreA n=1 Tax=Halanaerobacter jeridensis TaxID=706427 RepID=A0A938XSZ3_9FIRM|nr:transcription elongation factor GreA [Halanaerobacter jeridensis]MBM7557161.1 transcription elongation factor GreA [Halanaerobacter jeridensis]
MEEEKVLVSEEGLKKLKDELHHLRGPRRKEISQRIKEARELGDISENSEYEDAKNEQAFIEGRIRELEEKLKHAEVIDEDSIDTTEVNVGTTVTLHDEEFDEKVEYEIVGQTESDPDEGKISNKSPIGKGLLGHSVGEVVTIEVPAGEVEYKILGIRK